MSLSSLILISLRTELETDYSGIRLHLIFKMLTISQMTFDERCPIRNNNLKLSKLILRIFIKNNGIICPTKIPNGTTKIIVGELTEVFSELTEFVGALSSSWPVMSAR